MPARRRGAGTSPGGGNARISFLLRQAGEDDKGLLFSSPRIDETGHLRAETKGEADPALGGHVDLPIFAGQGVDRHGALRLQFPADITGFAGADSNNIVVRLFRNDSFVRTPTATWNAASGLLVIVLSGTVVISDVRTAIDGLSGITITNSLTGAANGSDNLVVPGANGGHVNRNLSGGRDEIPPGIDLLAQPDDEVNGPNILVKYDPADETTLQSLLDALEENDQGVTIKVPYGTDLTAAPEAVPFVRSYQGNVAEAPSTGTGGLTQGQVDGRVRALSKGYALKGGPDVPDSEIGSGIARDSEIKPYARVGGGDVPESDIPDAITRDDEVKSWARVGGGNVPEGQIDSRIARDTEVDAIRHNLSLKDVRNIVRNTDGTLEIELNDGTTFTAGKDLKSVRDQGAYSGAATYGERDLVLHGGGWYLANRTGFSGIEPRVTANWTNWWDFLCWQDGAPSSYVDASFDTDSSELVLENRAGQDKRVAVPTGGTAVAANPAGTDGDPLTRLAVAGTNFYIPQGYAWYARPTLSVPASITSDTNVPTAGRVFDLLNAETIDGGILASVDFTTEWFGCFEINIAAPGSGDAKARSLRATLITTHAFNGKSIVHERSADIGITENQFLCVPLSIFNSISRISLGAYRPADGDSDGSDDVEITAADLAGPVDISYQIRLQGIGRTGAAAAFAIEDLTWMRAVTRSYQIVHGEGGALPGPTPPAVRPSITGYALRTGDQTPVAGSIAGNRYQVDWNIAQTDHVGAARIIGFKGGYGDGTGATVIYNIPHGASAPGHPNIGWANGQSEVLIPDGVSLGADETYTLRLQVFGEGVTSPGLTTDPEAYADVVITAHAAATASVHWGAIAKVDGRSVADTVAAIDFSTDDDATGTALASGYTAVLPNDGNEYQVYLAVAASLDQPSGFTLGGQPYAGFEDAEDKTVSSTAYKVYLQSAALALTNSEGDGLRYGVTV